MEIESALVAHARVAEAAVVSKPHDIKGESVFAYVVLNVPRPQGAEAKILIDELRGWVGEQLSPIAKPDDIRLTDNLPKTRSGKIMRRLLRSIARGEEITQDMSTLENPGILDQLRGVPAAERAGRTAGRKHAAPRTRPARAERPAPKKAKPKSKPQTKVKTKTKAKTKVKTEAKAKAKSKSRARRKAPRRVAARSKSLKAKRK
jgi:hypothetical protein